MTEVSVDEVTLDDEPLEDASVDEKEIIEALDETGVAEDIIDGFDDDEMTSETVQKLVERLFPLPEGYPSEDIIAKWRKQYKNLRVRRANPGEAYVVRPLLRGELPGYYDIVSKAEEAEEDIVAQLRVEEELVSRCLLFPKVTKEQMKGQPDDDGDIYPIAIAGTVSVLATDVLFISRMIDDAVGPVEDL